MKNKLQILETRIKRKLNVVFAVILCISFAQTSKANNFKGNKILQQTSEIKGKITDADTGEALLGVSISVKGTSRGSTTDDKGNYTIKASSSETLVFSYLGYDLKEVLVGNQIIINVQLSPSESQLDEIVIKGISASRERALNIKRKNLAFVDAVSAEDVGKLPDQNIAEALQRVTGVAIQRTRGEGDFVSIRGLGPEFVRGTINGRSIVNGSEFFDQNLAGFTRVSSGRATNFDILPSEIINTLEVIKSTSAKIVEGGIGGSVNVKTARPLSLGNKFTGTLEGSYREFSKQYNPNISALYSYANEDNTFGFLASASYSERGIRDDASRGFGWFQFGTYDVDNDGIVDPDANVYIPLSHHFANFEEIRDRFTFTSTLQFKLDESSDLTFDFLYTKRTLETQLKETLLITLPSTEADWTSIGIPVNSDGSAQVASIYDGNVLTKIPFSLPPEIVTDRNRADDDLITLGLNYQKSFDNNWSIDADVSYVKAKGFLDFDRAVIVGGATGSSGAYAYATDITRDDFVTNDISSTANSLDPNGYWFRNGTLRDFNNDDSEFAFQMDAKKEFEGALSSVEFGVRARERKKDVAVSFFDKHFRPNSDGSGQFNLGSAGTPFLNGPENYLNGDLGGLGVSNFIYPEIDPYYNFLNSQTLYERDGSLITTDLEFDPLGSYNADEFTLASYAQANFNTSIGDLPVSGNAGFRLILTQQNIGGFARPFTIQGAGLQFTSPNNEVITFEDSYVNVLPNINLKFDLTETFLLRTAYSKSLTRPTFQDLAPALSINPNATIDLNGDGVAATASGGNPNLNPYESTNFDLGFEWYFKRGSAFYASFFYKQISDYIAGVTNENVELSGVIFDRFTQPDNQGEAQIGGLELGYQNAFENGFGYSANLTLIDSNAQFEQSGASIDFPGVSDVSYNISAFYDKGKFQSKLTWNYRGEFLLQPSPSFGEPLWTDSYGQLDGSISYDITDSISLFSNLVNLTNSQPKLFARSENLGSDRFYSRSNFGTRVSLGAKFNF